MEIGENELLFIILSSRATHATGNIKQNPVVLIMLCCIKQYIAYVSTLYTITKLTRLNTSTSFVDYNIEDGDTISNHHIMSSIMR